MSPGMRLGGSLFTFGSELEQSPPVLPPAPKPSAAVAEAPSAITQLTSQTWHLLRAVDASARAPEYLPLTPADAKEMEQDTGLIRRGEGALAGILELRPIQGSASAASIRAGEQAVLVTHRFGTPAEVVYALDLPPGQARSRVGQRVQVRGRFTAPEAGQRGAAVHSKLVRSIGSGVVRPGEEIAVSGRVSASMGAAVSSNGYSDPLGTFLELDQPLVLKGREVSRIYLEGGETLSLHQHLDLRGRLESKVYGDNVEPTLSIRVKPSGGHAHRRGDPRPMILDRGILESVSDLLGYRVEGLGVLQGELAIRTREGVEQPYLVTFRFGAETGFWLDLPLERARELVGKNVKVAGLIHNGLDVPDHISQATLCGLAPDRPRFKAGDWASLRGVVARVARVLPDGGLSYQRVLALHDHILIDGKRTQVIELPPSAPLSLDAKVEIHGQLGARTGADGQAKAACLQAIHAVAAAQDLDFFQLDAESVIDDFSGSAGPRLKVVVPDDQTAAEVLLRRLGP